MRVSFHQRFANQVFSSLLTRFSAIVLCSVLVEGCAANVNLDRVQGAERYDELTEFLGPLECSKTGKLQKCLYRKQTFNVFLLEKKTQAFCFLIDDSGRIQQRNITVSSKRYHLLPRFTLPPPFEEFR
jgi:hypothetical protein